MDIALKQRLVGASVLIALAVVVLPMLLGGRPESGSDDSSDIDIPESPPGLEFETRRFPVGAGQNQRPSQADSGQPIALPDPTTAANGQQEIESREALAHVELESGRAPDALMDDQQVTAPSSGPETPDDAASASKTSSMEPAAERMPPVAAAAPGGRYVVQVASFGSLANANRLSAKLRDLGYAVLMDSVASDAGTLNRVRVGPYPTEAAAGQAVATLRTQFSDVKPRMVDLTPEESAQVTQPSDPLVRWVVQVGSFSSAANADKLVARLRDEGMSAYKEALNRSGSTIYRVRVGPFTERDDALQADQKISDRLAMDGVVMSAD